MGRLTKYVTILKLAAWIWWRTLSLLNLEWQRGKDKKGRESIQQRHDDVASLCRSGAAPTGYEAGEVRLNGLELVDVILPLLIGDLPGVVVGAGLSLDLVGRRCWGHCSYRCAFLKETNKWTFKCIVRTLYLEINDEPVSFSQMSLTRM